MQQAIANTGLMWRTRNLVFFAAVLLMFYTLAKPSPVDMAFAGALALTPLVNQRVTSNCLLLILLLGAWSLSVVYSSLPFWGEADVPFEVVQKVFVACLAITAAFAAASWRMGQFRTFLVVYVVACAITSVLGIIGFFTGLELLTWDARAKGLINDPNMYAEYVGSGLIVCLYLFGCSKRWVLLTGVTVLLLIGLMLSFSRVAIVACVICCGIYLAYVNRKRPGKLILAAIAGALALALLLVLMLAFGGDEFSAKLMDRLTVAKSYDLGREGRYERYLRAMPMILENARGIGALQVEKIFVEPIHNIWIGQFLYYGWVAGFAWISSFVFSVVITIRNQRLSDDPLPTLLFITFFFVVTCASVHEGENWRPLWLFLGMIYGYTPRAQEGGIRVTQRPAYAPAMRAAQ